MKTKIYLSMLTCVALALFSCSSDDDKSNSDTSSTFEESYFTIQDGEFKTGSMPESNSTELSITSVDGNSTILPGGSNNISIAAEGDPTHTLIGIEGQSGYYQLPYVNSAGRSLSSTVTYDIVQILIGQGAESDFTIVIAVIDEDGNVSEYVYLVVTIIEAGTGLLQVNCSWNKENDVDLHLKEPNGEVIYYANATSQNGGMLDIDSNAGCSIDGINSENIFYEDSSILEAGEYEVMVDLWSNCDIPNNTNYTVTVYFDGQLINVTEGSNPFNDSFTPADDSNGPLSIAKFIIGADRPSAVENEFNNINTVKSYRFHFDNERPQDDVLSPEKL
ncbi:hypothetical protein [Psychroflexus aestuariivivens]|uniref:hypothetical protein n=1 Tax=Psychroflexus aestuariivivens TaxID=1795040 RepID=UPI000FD7FCAC|nr:hypothetical protein [Psychroflexus aestuariivivens]